MGALLEPKQLLGMDTLPLRSWSNMSLEKLLSEEKRVTKPPKPVLLNVVCLPFFYLSACREEGGNKVVADDCEQRLLLVEVLSNVTLVCVLQHFLRGWT